MAMTKEQRAAKALDKQIEQAYYKHCSGTSISMLDIPKLFNEVRADVLAGKELEASVIAAIAKYNATKVS